MAEDPDDIGPLTSGFDDDFREPVKLPPVDGSGPGTTNRIEDDPVLFPCQIEPNEFERLQMIQNGNEGESSFSLVMHFRWLELNGFVDSGGNAKINIGDRLIAIYDCRGTAVLTLREPMYVEQAMPASFGIGHSRNLLIVTFKGRMKGPSA